MLRAKILDEFLERTRIGLFGVGGCYPSNRRVGDGPAQAIPYPYT